MDLSNLISSENLAKSRKNIKKVFFFRICGTGMGSAACLLKEAGYDVEGGDKEFFPPMSDYLKSTNIPLHNLENITADYLQKFDLIVVGNVVGRKSDDARFIEQTGVPFASFPSVLGALVLKDINVIGVAGTHGKTTTTYLITQLFENLGENPGYLIAGVMHDRQSAKLGDGKWFFIESDEYDSAYFEKISKFRLYELNHLILTSLEFDHGDIFSSIEDIKNEFRAMMPNLTGCCVANNEYKAVRELYGEFQTGNITDWYFYGDYSGNGPKILNMDSKGTKFIVKINDRETEFFTNITGEQNILNLTSGIILAAHAGFSVAQINKAIATLNMVRRRQEVRGIYKGAVIIDDFAHHPRSVAMTIDNILTRFNGQRLVVVICPSSATARSSIFQQEFTDALRKADHIIAVKPEKPTTIQTADNLDVEKIVTDLAKNNISAQSVNELSALRKMIDQQAQPGTVLLVMSNSTCRGLWESDFVEHLT